MMNEKSIFIDTGAWIALSDKSDQYHKKAVTYIRKLTKGGYGMITTNMVIHETFMLLSRRLSRTAAITFLDEVYNDSNVEIFHSDENCEQEAFSIIRKYIDQDFSVTDCVSFVIMKREKLKQVFTFDKHFKTMQFSIEP